MSTAKEQFIGRISNSLGRNRVSGAPGPLWLPHDVHHDYLRDSDGSERTETFIENSKAAGTAVYQCDAAGLNTTLIKAVSAFGGGSVVLANHDFFSKAKSQQTLEDHFEQVQTWDRSLSREENIATAERANVGIVKAELALAESGTVLLFSHWGSGRSISLLPTYTITVIREQDIQPRLSQAMLFLRQQIKVGLPSSVNCISGASSTADIELVRVQGVHGPLATAYLIIS